MQQQYQSILNEKGLSVEQLSKPLQKQISGYEENLEKYNSLSELIETDQIEDDKIDGAKESLQEYLEILNSENAAICKKLEKFDLEVYTKNTANLARGRSVNSKTNGSRSKKNAAPIVVANQGTAVATTAQQTQFEATDTNGKKLPITEEKPKDKKGMPMWAKVTIGIFGAAAAAFGIKVAIDEYNK